MGASTVSKFYRLYMFPGVYHCGGGYGPNVFDLLTPPEEVKYAGRGDPDQAASYVPVAPSAPRHDDYRWAGYPFRSGYEQWCRLVGDAKALVCKREGEQGA